MSFYIEAFDSVFGFSTPSYYKRHNRLLVSRPTDPMP